MSFSIKPPQRKDASSFDSNFYGTDTPPEWRELGNLVPSIEKIAARAGAPIVPVDTASLAGNAPPTEHKPAPHNALSAKLAANESKQRFKKLEDSELSRLDGELRRLIDARLIEHQFNFSWMPEPVTLGQAYAKLGVSTPKDLLHKISAADPLALELGFRPSDRPFFKERIDEAEALAAQEIALELIDGGVANSPIEIGKEERVAALLHKLGVASRYELKLRMNDPAAMLRHFGQDTIAEAMNATKPRERAVIGKLERDLERLATPTASLVENGLALGLLNRARAVKNAEFVKDFNARPEGDKLAFLQKYLHRQYGVRGERHSALDNPDILRFVEGSLSSDDRNTFINLFRTKKSAPPSRDIT